jgi:hypothetical protein
MFIHKQMLSSFLSFSQPIKRLVGFEDMKYIISNPTKFLIINTLPVNDHDILILGTIPLDREESVINDQLTNYSAPDLPVIIYGRNSCDLSVDAKQTQLRSLGIKDVYVYAGGLFEWLMLGEVYGFEEFPIENRHRHKRSIDILHYRALRSV